MDTTEEIKIFIVEDDFVFANILSELIDTIIKKYKDSGIQISYNTFYSVKEAEFELRKHPSIILLDYFIMNDEMEIDTASPFLKAVKSEDPEIEVIIVSGQDDKELIYKLKRQGATEFVSKARERCKNWFLF